MSTYISGNISITLPEHIEISHAAGKLSINQVLRIPKPYKRGTGKLCQELADIIDKTPEFTVAPEGICDALRDAGAKADDLKPYVFEAKNLLKTLQQQSLLNDSAAYALIRQVNDLVKAQVKQNPQLANTFYPLNYYFNRKKTQTNGVANVVGGNPTGNLADHATENGADNAPGDGTTNNAGDAGGKDCHLYTSPSPRDLSTSRMPSSA